MVLIWVGEVVFVCYIPVVVVVLYLPVVQKHQKMVLPSTMTCFDFALALVLALALVSFPVES